MIKIVIECKKKKSFDITEIDKQFNTFTWTRFYHFIIYHLVC